MPVIDPALCPYRDGATPTTMQATDVSPDTEPNGGPDTCQVCANPSAAFAVAVLHSAARVSWPLSDASLTRPLWAPLAPVVPPRA
jgi:hypothetical protein